MWRGTAFSMLLFAGALATIPLWTFNVFTPFLITGGGPAFRSETVPIYVYRTAFQYYDLGRGSAVAVVMLAVNLVVALAYLAVVRRRAQR